MDPVTVDHPSTPATDLPAGTRTSSKSPWSRSPPNSSCFEDDGGDSIAGITSWASLSPAVCLAGCAQQHSHCARKKNVFDIEDLDSPVTSQCDKYNNCVNGSSVNDVNVKTDDRTNGTSSFPEDNLSADVCNEASRKADCKTNNFKTDRCCGEHLTKPRTDKKTQSSRVHCVSSELNLKDADVLDGVVDTSSNNLDRKTNGLPRCLTTPLTLRCHETKTVAGLDQKTVESQITQCIKENIQPPTGWTPARLPTVCDCDYDFTFTSPPPRQPDDVKSPSQTNSSHQQKQMENPVLQKLPTGVQSPFLETNQSSVRQGSADAVFYSKVKPSEDSNSTEAKRPNNPLSQILDFSHSQQSERTNTPSRKPSLKQTSSRKTMQSKETSAWQTFPKEVYQEEIASTDLSKSEASALKASPGDISRRATPRTATSPPSPPLPAWLETAHVRDAYNYIAPQCSHVRQEAWPVVRRFLRELSPGSLVADVGCGSGRYLDLRADVITLGSDVCAAFTQQARGQGHEVALADNLDLPYRGHVFDAVLSVGVVHHLASRDRRVKAVGELARVLAPGGKLLVYVWAFEQVNRKFESQDVLIPWVRPDSRGRIKKRQSSCRTSKRREVRDLDQSASSRQCQARHRSRSASDVTDHDRSCDYDDPSGQTMVVKESLGRLSNTGSASAENVKNGQSESVTSDAGRQRAGGTITGEEESVVGSSHSSITQNKFGVFDRRRSRTWSNYIGDRDPDGESCPVARFPRQLSSECQKLKKFLTSLSRSSNVRSVLSEDLTGQDKKDSHDDVANAVDVRQQSPVKDGSRVSENKETIQCEVSSDRVECLANAVLDASDYSTSSTSALFDNCGLTSRESTNGLQMVSQKSHDKFSHPPDERRKLPAANVESNDYTDSDPFGFDPSCDISSLGQSYKNLESLKQFSFSNSQYNEDEWNKLKKRIHEHFEKSSDVTLDGCSIKTSSSFCITEEKVKLYPSYSKQISDRGKKYDEIFNETLKNGDIDKEIGIISHISTGHCEQLDQDVDDFVILESSQDGVHADSSSQSVSWHRRLMTRMACAFNPRPPGGYDALLGSSNSDNSEKPTSMSSLSSTSVFSSTPSSGQIPEESNSHGLREKRQDSPEVEYELINDNAAFVEEQMSSCRDVHIDVSKESLSFINDVTKSPGVSNCTSIVKQNDVDGGDCVKKTGFMDSLSKKWSDLITRTKIHGVKRIQTDSSVKRSEVVSPPSFSSRFNYSNDCVSSKTKRPTSLDFSKKRTRKSVELADRMDENARPVVARQEEKSLTLAEAMTLIGNGVSEDTVVARLDSDAQVIFAEMRRLDFSIRQFPMSSVGSGENNNSAKSERDSGGKCSVGFGDKSDLSNIKKERKRQNKTAATLEANGSYRLCRRYSDSVLQVGILSTRADGQLQFQKEMEKTGLFRGAKHSRKTTRKRRNPVITKTSSAQVIRCKLNTGVLEESNNRGEMLAAGDKIQTKGKMVDQQGGEALCNKSSSTEFSCGSFDNKVDIRSASLSDNNNSALANDISTGGNQCRMQVKVNEFVPTSTSNLNGGISNPESFNKDLHQNNKFSRADSNPESHSDAKLSRYYHLFRKGELDDLINTHVPSLEILDSFYDHGNWL